MERFEIFTICRRPPVLQTDASVGMMKIVVCETEARKASGRRTSTPQSFAQNSFGYKWLK